MEYQLYEIMLFFSIYSILGWLADACFEALVTKDALSTVKICKGPWRGSWGVGAILILTASQSFGGGPVWGFILGALIGSVIGGIRILLIASIVNERKQTVALHRLILYGVCGVLLVCHLHPLLTAYVRWMNPWVHMAFLIFFWLRYPGEVIEGIASRRGKK